MLKFAKKGYKEINVVNDQIGSPTFTKDLSCLIVEMINSNKYGIYNVTNEGYISKATFAKAIFKLYNLDIKVKNINTNEYNKKYGIDTLRPLYSKLSKNKLVKQGFKKLPN